MDCIPISYQLYQYMRYIQILQAHRQQQLTRVTLGHTARSQD